MPRLPNAAGGCRSRPLFKRRAREGGGSSWATRRGASPRVCKMNMNRIVRGLSLAAILAFGPGASVGCRPCTQNGGPAGVILEPILGALDAPARGNTLRGTGIVGGWAVAESRVKRIAIYVDGQFVSFAPLDRS